MGDQTLWGRGGELAALWSSTYLPSASMVSPLSLASEFQRIADGGCSNLWALKTHWMGSCSSWTNCWSQSGVAQECGWGTKDRESGVGLEMRRAGMWLFDQGGSCHPGEKSTELYEVRMLGPASGQKQVV